MAGMKTYWTLAPIGEHPAGAREIDIVGYGPLADHACQGFLTDVDLLNSLRFGDIISDDDDAAKLYEIARITGDSSTEKREGAGVEGIFVEVVSVDERIPLLDFVARMEASSDAKVELQRKS